MTLKTKIQGDIKEAMKAKDELRLSVLRMLLATLQNRELEKRAKAGKPEELTEEEVVAALRSEVKKRKDSIGEFEKGGRQDLADKEAAELTVLEKYLPAELPDDEIAKIVQDVVRTMGAITEKEFGKVMGEAMKRVRGQASGDRVSKAVRACIGK